MEGSGVKSTVNEIGKGFHGLAAYPQVACTGILALALVFSSGVKA
jgi:hypothetical protein